VTVGDVLKPLPARRGGAVSRLLESDFGGLPIARRLEAEYPANSATASHVRHYLQHYCGQEPTRACVLCRHHPHPYGYCQCGCHVPF
jgi:hypothetical protein